MITIVYASRAVRKLDEAALTELLIAARERNACGDVSGMLVYASASFLQQLEGERDVVDGIFRSIMADPRHRDIRLLSRRPTTTRHYEGWAMGFDHPDATSLATRLPGYRATLQAPLANCELIDDSQIAETLLELCATGGQVKSR